MLTFKFLFGASLASTLLAMVTPVTKAVQGYKVMLSEAICLVSQLCIALAGQRDRFPEFWKGAVARAKELGVDEPLLPRPIKQPKRLEDGAPAHRDTSPEDAYRRLYYEGIDALSISLRSRFGENEDTNILLKKEGDTDQRPKVTRRSRSFLSTGQ